MPQFEDMHGFHKKILYLLGMLEELFGITNPARVERDVLMKAVMVIFMCRRRNANKWVNFLVRLYLKDWL